MDDISAPVVDDEVGQLEREVGDFRQELDFEFRGHLNIYLNNI